MANPNNVWDHAELCGPRGGGATPVIKVGTDVRQVQNLGRAKFLKKPNAGQKSAQKPNDQQVFMNFRYRVPKLEMLTM